MKSLNSSPQRSAKAAPQVKWDQVRKALELAREDDQCRAKVKNLAKAAPGMSIGVRDLMPNGTNVPVKGPEVIV